MIDVWDGDPESLRRLEADLLDRPEFCEEVFCSNTKRSRSADSLNTRGPGTSPSQTSMAREGVPAAWAGCDHPDRLLILGSALEASQPDLAIATPVQVLPRRAKRGRGS